VALKQAVCIAMRAAPRPKLRNIPSVTIFITSSNNRYPLEVTLRTLMRTTDYPNYSIVIADNGSTDGSLELLDELGRGIPLTVLAGAKQEQSRWYDYAFQNFASDYWLGLHEDLIFLGNDWLLDLLARMENDRDLYLLGGEEVSAKGTFHEPVSGRLVHRGESLSTWIFCVRTSLRDRLDSSFAFHVRDDVAGSTPILYDQGGKLLMDMAERGLAYGFMPWSFRLKWHHVGNLTWIRRHPGHQSHVAFKEYQRKDLEHRAKRLAADSSAEVGNQG
jgi:glycosyltransferase involved in cell wall biosynthesis